MTTPDPRTDLAGWLGLTYDQIATCHRSNVDAGPPGVYAKVGARLIEQDQARADEPDDGLIPVTVRLTAEEVRARRAMGTFIEGPLLSSLRKLSDACAAVDLPAPWKSPLADLPDLTRQQCDDAYDATRADPDMPFLKGVIGRALIAAGWTPEEEA